VRKSRSGVGELHGRPGPRRRPGLIRPEAAA